MIVDTHSTLLFRPHCIQKGWHQPIQMPLVSAEDGTAAATGAANTFAGDTHEHAAAAHAADGGGAAAGAGNMDGTARCRRDAGAATSCVASSDSQCSVDDENRIKCCQKLDLCFGTADEDCDCDRAAGAAGPATPPSPRTAARIEINSTDWLAVFASHFIHKKKWLQGSYNNM